MRGQQGLATAGRWTEAFGGGPFTVVAPDPVEGPTVGGFTGWADAPSSLSLHHAAGAQRKHVEVVTDRNGHRDDIGLMVRVLFRVATQKRLRFPVVIERSTLRIKIGARRRAFNGFAIGDGVVGAAEIDGLRVTVICPAGDPRDGFELARFEGPELTRLMRNERQRWNSRRREAREAASRSPAPRGVPPAE